jgi:tetratricopeptide (TPR) repeat protein
MKPIDPNVAFQSAEKAVGRGDWQGARRAYGRVLKSMPKEWRGFYRAGVLEARGGHYSYAEKALARALSLCPDNVQIAANLAQVYLLTDRPAEAINLIGPAAANAPNSPDIQRQLGVAYQELGQINLAEEAYGRAMDLGSSDPVVLNNRAVVLQTLGRPVEALSLLELLKAKGDDRLETLNNLGNLYRVLGRNGQSAEIFAQALKRTPLSTSLHRNLALLKRDGGQVTEGLAAARRAAVCDPSEIDGLVIMAEMLEHQANLFEAKRLLRRAVVGAPDDADATSILARIHRREGDSEAALLILRESPASSADRPGKHKLLFEKAQANQALGDFEEAFQTLIEANSQQISAMPPGRVDPERAFQQVRDLTGMIEFVNALEFVDDRRADPKGAPVFLIGFPRSGTTLLDQVLDSHPEIVVLEERPLVNGMITRIKSAGFQYPQDVPRLDDGFLDELRLGYQTDRDSYVDVPEGGVFVDKMPLNIVHAALIGRVFPNARFIMALRDPCDVCLSCFMQSFELNDWMAVFTDIDATARLHDAVFDLWTRTSEKLSLMHHVVRYEDLISDLRGTASAAIRFLGLEWDDDMARFHEHARNRGHLSTPSHSQVTQPVYTHAIRRWKRYGAAMDGVAQFLESRRSALGYGD